MISSSVPKRDSGSTIAATGMAIVVKSEGNGTAQEFATPSENPTSNPANTDSSAAETTLFTPRKEETQKVTPAATERSDESENAKLSYSHSNNSGLRSRCFRRSEQDPIIAPGFGTARDIRRLAAQLSEGNEIQISPEVVQEIMNARGQGIMSRRRSNNNELEQATTTSTSAWADFMKEEGVLAGTEASKSVASSTTDRKRPQDTNDGDGKKTKTVSAEEEDDTKDLLVQHHGILLQAGTLDSAAVGRSKGTTKNPPVYNLMVPTKILPKVIVRSVHTSSSACHSIAISNSGVVYGWGRNECHQLASNLLDDVSLPTVLDVPKHSPVIAAATGKSHSLFLYADGSVYAVGSNKAGQCGVKANIESIGNYRKCIFQQRGETVEYEIKQIACGEDFSMAVSSEGYLFSAGSSEFGQLGNGETGEYIVTAGKTGFANSTFFGRRSTFSHAPDDNGFNNNKAVKVVPLEENDIRIEKVACGRHHTIAIEMSGDNAPRVFSWGSGGYGCLGHGGQEDEYYPRLISALRNTMKVVAPGMRPKSTLSVSAGTTCSLLQLPNGHVYYWGKHRSVGESMMRPSLVDALANNGHIVRHVDAGYQTVVVSTANAVTVAWGQGPNGELGLGEAKSSSKPTFVPSLDGCRVASLACGYGHTLFIVRNDDKEDKAAVKKLPDLDPAECQPLIDASEAKTKKKR